MFIVFDSILLIVIVTFKKVEHYQLNNNSNNYYFIINMWLLSRCISIDALNSCFQQQKSKINYDFCLCREKPDAFPTR